MAKTKKRYPVAYLAYNDTIEQKIGANGKFITNPELSANMKVLEPVGYVEDLVEEEAGFEKGEKGYFKRIAAMQKVLIRNKVGYEWELEAEVFTVTNFQANINKTVFKSCFVGEDGLYYCCDQEYTRDYCATSKISEFNTFIKSQLNLKRYGTR